MWPTYSIGIFFYIKYIDTNPDSKHETTYSIPSNPGFPSWFLSRSSESPSLQDKMGEAKFTTIHVDDVIAERLSARLLIVQCSQFAFVCISVTL